MVSASISQSDLSHSTIVPTRIRAQGRSCSSPAQRMPCCRCVCVSVYVCLCLLVCGCCAASLVASAERMQVVFPFGGREHQPNGKRA